MLNWICPECGRENDPNLPECPGCADPQAAAQFSTAQTRRADPVPVLAGRVALPQQTPTAPTQFLRIDAEPAEAAPSFPVVEVATQAVELSRAPLVPYHFQPTLQTSEGPALAAMLQAINIAPNLLAPGDAQEIDSARPVVPRALCGTVSWPAWEIGPSDPRVIRRHVWPEAYARVVVLPESSALEFVPPVARCETIFRIRGPQPMNPGPPAARQPRALARGRRRISLPLSRSKHDVLVPAPLCGTVALPAPVHQLRNVAAVPRATGPVFRNGLLPALPSALQRFQEAVVPRIAYVKRAGAPENASAAERRRVPAWAISVGTATIVLLVALFAIQRFAGHSEVHAAATHTAAAPSGAAWGAWPSIDKFVEITGLRLTTDQKRNSEAVFTAVNHSSTDVGPLSVKITLASATAGEAPLCDITTRVESLAPWESREVRVALPREIHASELPEWHDMHPQVVITSAQ